MKKTKNIHTLDSLEREIYRLRLEARETEEKLDSNFAYLHENFDTLLLNSFSKRNKQEKDQSSSFISALKSHTLNAVINKMISHVADRMIKGIDNLACRLFRGKK